MSSEHPKVTIAIPTFNRADLLVQAINSALGQTYPNIEIIVSDNASRDHTREVIDTFEGKIKVIYQQHNLGMTRNWEVCLAHATGEYFLLLSDDDFLDTQAIELLVAAYENNNDIAFIYGRTTVYNPDGSTYQHPVTPPCVENASKFVIESFKSQRFSPTGATLFRTVELIAVGGYLNHSFNLVPDAAVLMKVALLDPRRNVKFIDANVFNYRVHASNLTGSTKLQIWADEISGLSKMVADRLNQAMPTAITEFRKYSSRYLVSVIMSLAASHSGGGFRTKWRLLSVCCHVCRPFLDKNSIKTFCFGSLKLISPALVQILNQLRNEKKL